MTQRTSGGTPVNYTLNDLNQVASGPVGANGYDANGNRTLQTYETGVSWIFQNCTFAEHQNCTRAITQGRDVFWDGP
jgi:ABC-type polar amino acid transport system ATPase subunit